MGNNKKPDVTASCGKCNCCPYGYHIDLDFVRYCESLSNGQYLNQLKQLHRSRRRQRKSMEALLSSKDLINGSTNSQEPSLDGANLCATSPLPPPPPDIVRLTTDNKVKDPLHLAMIDFEEALQNTGTKYNDLSLQNELKIYEDSDLNSSGLDLKLVDLLSNTPTAMHVSGSDISETPSPKFSSPTHGIMSDELPSSINVLSPNDFHRYRSDSMSSESTISSFTDFDGRMANAAVGMQNIVLPSQQMADTMATLTNTMGGSMTDYDRSPSAMSQSGIVINPFVLQSIRDQMALSLQRMKELEDHAKSLPILQVKLSVLKEEKRLLLLQLKAKAKSSKKAGESMGVDCRSVGVGDSLVFENEEELAECERRLDALGIYATLSHRPRRKSLADCCLGLHFRSRSMSPGQRTTVNPEEFHSFRLFHGDDKKNESDSAKHIKVEAEINELKVEQDVPKPIPVKNTRTTGVNCVPITRDIGTSHICHPTKSVGVACEIHLPPKPCLACEERKLLDKKISSRKPALAVSVQQKESISPYQTACPHCEEHKKKLNSCKTVSTNTDGNLEPKKKPIQTIHRSCNTDRKFTCIATVQAAPEQQSHLVQTDSPKVIKPEMKNVMVTAKPEVHHVGVNVESKSTIALRNIGVGDQSVLDSICEKCKFKNYKTVGVGLESVKNVVCDRCSNIRKHDSSVGTDPILNSKRTVGTGYNSIFDIVCDKCKNLSVVSIAVGTEAAPADVKPEVQICDKCSSTIQSMAENVMQKVLPSPRRTSFGSGGMEWIKKWEGPKKPVSSTQSSSDRVVHKPKSREEGFYSKKFKDFTTTVITTSTPISGSTTTSTSRITTRHTGRRENGLRSNIPRPQTQTKVPPKVTVTSGTPGHPESGSSDGSDSSGDDSSSDSPDEGSYDGVCGSIVNKCEDDEAIRRGLPGASMFQPIHDYPRIKKPLSQDILDACKRVNDHIVRNFGVLSKEYHSSLNLIQQDWFRISSQKNSDAHTVEDYLDTFEEMSKQLLSRIVNLSDSNGNTALHYAISHANFDVVSLLLDSKVCDINKPNKAGYTSIMLASLAVQKDDSHNDVLQRMFHLGDVNIKATQHGQTALMLAVSRGRTDVVKMLLEAGADVNIQDKDGSTALMCASEHGHLGIVKLLLAHPDIDASLTDNDGSTALSVAMEAGHKDIGVLIYAQTSFSRGSSPYASLRLKRRGTPTRLTSTPPRTPPPPSPALSRKSTASTPY